MEMCCIIFYILKNSKQRSYVIVFIWPSENTTTASEVKDFFVLHQLDDKFIRMDANGGF